MLSSHQNQSRLNRAFGNGATQNARSDHADSESVPSLCYSFGLDRSRNEFRNVEKFSGRDTLFGAKACSTLQALAHEVDGEFSARVLPDEPYPFPGISFD